MARWLIIIPSVPAGGTFFQQGQENEVARTRFMNKHQHLKTQSSSAVSSLTQVNVALVPRGARMDRGLIWRNETWPCMLSNDEADL